MSAHVNDIGTLIKIDVHSDISSAISLGIAFKRPDKTIGMWSAVLVDSTTIGHVTVDGDLDQPGTWTIQPVIDLPMWTGAGDQVNFVVEKNISI
jgi:hypothetical protein